MRRKVRWGVLLLAAMLTLLLAPAAAGASECTTLYLYCFDGSTSFESFGVSVAGAGDVNRDGVGDFIIGGPGANFRAGRAVVFSGSNYAQLFPTFVGPAGSRFGSSVAGAGDVNGDGYDDLIVGAPFANSLAGSAFVFSGYNGAQLFPTLVGPAGSRFGSSVAGAGDVNGDGYADFVVGAPFANSWAGSAFVFSGYDGALLLRVNGTNPGDTLGTSVAGAGDVDGDGWADLIVGAPGANSFAGSAFVFGLAPAPTGGYNRVDLHRFDGTRAEGTAGDKLGSSVAGVGDVNADGRADLVVGAPLADPDGLVDAGSAYLYSGASGVRLFSFNGPTSDARLGTSVASAGDVDGNRRPDVIVGAPNSVSAAGIAYVYSGSSYRELVSVQGAASGDEVGKSVGGPWNGNGDGQKSLLAGAPGMDLGSVVDAGRAFVFTPGQVQNPLPNTIDLLLEWVNDQVASGNLEGAGPSNMAAYRLKALINMLEAVRNHLANGNSAGACQQLAQALTRTDGQASPPDFVAAGPVADQLADAIRKVQAGYC